MWKVGSISFALCMLLLLLFPLKADAAVLDSELPATFLEFDLDESLCRLDGTLIQPDGMPLVENGLLFLPLRTTAEAFGYKVTWDSISGQAVVSSGMRTISLTPGKESASVSEQGASTVISLAAAPKSVGGRIMVPSDCVPVLLDCQIRWDQSSEKCLLSTVGPGGQTIGADKMIAYLAESGKSDAGVTIAVIDTGVDIDHLYLKDRIVSPFNAVDGSDNVYDAVGHGTKVAGIIANCTPETVKIMPIKVDEKGGYDSATIAKAVTHAFESGADIINISLTASADRDNFAVSEAVSAAISAGCPVVVAAGNERSDVLEYTPSNVGDAIVVSAVNQDETLWLNSNYGSTVVVAAPGVGIATTVASGNYGIADGTSMAAPYVSAAAALIRMDISGITPAELRNLLLDYSRDTGPLGWDPQYGGGIVDLSGYVTLRKEGLIGDLTKSAEEKASILDAQIEALRKQKLEEHLRLYGIFWSPLFAADLCNESQNQYNQGDYFAAGYYLEKSIEFYPNGTACNNLAYMARRGEYFPRQYSIQWLLDQAETLSSPHAYINEALLLAAKGEWDEADQIVGDFCQQYMGSPGMSMVIQSWKSLSNQNDGEGDLVLGWLMRYHVDTGSPRSQEYYLDRAAKKYPYLPEWMRSAT